MMSRQTSIMHVKPRVDHMEDFCGVRVALQTCAGTRKRMTLQTDANWLASQVDARVAKLHNRSRMLPWHRGIVQGDTTAINQGRLSSLDMLWDLVVQLK